MELWLDRPEVLKRLMWGHVTFFSCNPGVSGKETALWIHIPEVAECSAQPFEGYMGRKSTASI